MSSSPGPALAPKTFPTLTVALLLAATSLSAAHFKPSPVVSHIPREIPPLMALLIGLFFSLYVLSCFTASTLRCPQVTLSQKGWQGFASFSVQAPAAWHHVK